MRKNIILTGAPSSGKTTVIRKIIDRLDCPTQGFFTEEERVDGRRSGFMMISLGNERGYLAHQDISSDIRIRRYGVNIENVENIAARSIEPKEGTLIILDEIGKMECFSLKFRETVVRALASPNIVIGTITLGGGDFIKSVKSRDDIEIVEVNPENRNELPEMILKKIRALQKAHTV